MVGHAIVKVNFENFSKNIKNVEIIHKSKKSTVEHRNEYEFFCDFFSNL
jgi:hypothetical protein